MLRLTTIVVATLVVVALGAASTSPADAQENCHPSYTGGECLDANASDYDCAGGEGNGPLYVNYQVQIVGDDVFDLDGDNDGIGCDSLPVFSGGSTTTTENPTEKAGLLGAPTAGFGPDDASVSIVGLAIAGLVGAALAWLTAGGLGLRLLSQDGASLRQNTGAFVPRMRPRN